jgi:hypothetical protein
MSGNHYQSKCPNCQHHIGHSDRFCPSCGQNLHAVKQPFTHFLEEFLESTLHFDGKVWSTMKKLFINPGIVIREYNENKKARFVPPIRLYIFISFLYFLLISGGVEKNVSFAKTQILDTYGHNNQEGSFSINFLTHTKIPYNTAKALFQTEGLTEARIDSVLKSEHIKTDAFNNKVLLRMVKIERGEISPKDVSHELLSATSKMIFVLMPLFALILMVVIGFRKVFYAETLVFSMYFHAFLLTLLIIASGIESLSGWALGKNIALLAAIIYLLISIKHVFSLNWLQSTLKTLIVLLVYACFFILTYVVAIMFSFVLYY